MVLPPHLLERWRRELWFYSSTVPSFEQDTLALFMQRGHFERHLARARNRYKARREALRAADFGSRSVDELTRETAEDISRSCSIVSSSGRRPSAPSRERYSAQSPAPFI